MDFLRYQTKSFRSIAIHTVFGEIFDKDRVLPTMFFIPSKVIIVVPFCFSIRDLILWIINHGIQYLYCLLY